VPSRAASSTSNPYPTSRMGPLIDAVAAIRGALDLVGARPDSLPASSSADGSLATAMQAMSKSSRIYE
jgi:hypothetical protein